ncbi:FtsK/SpoIIIE domain-containing protein [Pseudolysinimonas sp.]|uniref:FtsK/SpoIIIE domain-containing protein n=1 Tax=Pseudolysinimonas sp. TaxID=2680009 RepID=UPI003F7D271E
MRLKLTLRRDDGSDSDIVVTTDAGASIAEVAGALERVDPRSAGSPATGPQTLRAALPGAGSPVMLPPDAAIGEAWIGSGATVELVDAARFRPGSHAAGRPPVARLRILSGAQSGRSWELSAGSIMIGRDPGCDVVLADDPMVSKRHARVDVESSIEIVDLGSANGVLVDGGLVGRFRVEDRVEVVIGDTRLEVTRIGEGEAPPTAGPVFFNRSPRIEPRYAGQQFTGPEVPQEVINPPFPYVAMFAPLGMGAVMFTLQPRALSSLIFVALSPLLMAGNWVSQLIARRGQQKRAKKRFDEHLTRLTADMDAERVREHELRLREAPATTEVLDASVRRAPLLWTRRPEHWSFLNVRLGLGTMRSRNTIQEDRKPTSLPDYQARFDEVLAANREVEGVPIVDNLHDAGALGLAGPDATAAEAANALLVQLTGLHSPAEVVLAAAITPAWSEHLDWIKWLPHAASPQSPIEGVQLADSPASAAQLVSAIEGLVASRLAKRDAQRRGAAEQEALALERGANVGRDHADGTASPIPAVILLISDDVPVDRGRLVQLAELAADAGVFPIWLARDVASLPAVCRTFVELDADGAGRVGLVRLGETVDPVAVERVTAGAALDYARRLAPVIDAGAVVADSSDLPRTVSLVTLLGHDLVESSEAVIDRWRQNESIHDRTPGVAPRKRRPGKLRAIIGSSGVDAMHLDLRTQGPHALVGGTTGAGKSEFLQAWVLGMAAEYSPDRVTFLFVDYKGGSAFADCVSLPHCVGLVTDLSPHLVRRALTSLRAELHHREHLLNRKKAKDLLELERRGDPDSPPALVLVIDEFAALAGEVPEFVDGVVDIAQRGRSLGIHLIMATQRPAGVIKDNLRANTNMRVALRMADESDSDDVVGVKDAGGFDPGIPGRGLAKTGPGRLTMFQSGYAGGWTSREPERSNVEVIELRFGGEVRWEEPRSGTPEPERDLGPTDQQRLVAQMIHAAGDAGIPAPRRPWLDQLATVYDLAKLHQRTDQELVMGVTDLPQSQEQRPVYFTPDVDGHLAIYGTGGSGKSTVLRSLAAAAAITPRGGPVQVYALDFGSGSLRMLETLPHVGAVIAGEDAERIVRLFRMLKDELEARGPLFAAHNASGIAEYRRNSGDAQRARILLLIDGFPSFREDFEIPAGRSQWYDVFRDILGEGRQLGIHVALTADRPGAVPASISSSIQRRVVLRLADDSYGMLDVPSDILSASSPPGRAIVDREETQIAVFGGDPVVAEQAAALRSLGDAMRRAGVPSAPAIGSLPTEYTADDLPPSLDGTPVLGVSEADLGPFGFDPSGTLLLAGPPASGRTSALISIAQSLERSDADLRLYYIGSKRSPVASALDWVERATTPEEAAALARSLSAAMLDEDTEGRIAVVIESLGDFLQSAADGPIVELAKAAKRSEHLVMAEAESSAWGSSWPLMGEFKNGRRGLLLQPDSVDGDLLLKTPLPRLQKSEFPPGRGMYIARGKFARVQLPLPS